MTFSLQVNLYLGAKLADLTKVVAILTVPSGRIILETFGNAVDYLRLFWQFQLGHCKTSPGSEIQFHAVFSKSSQPVILFFMIKSAMVAKKIYLESQWKI